jgi:hypothetical protein
MSLMALNEKFFITNATCKSFYFLVGSHSGFRKTENINRFEKKFNQNFNGMYYEIQKNY